MGSSSNSGSGRPSKVARLIDEYGLDGVGAELERRWTADSAERSSLRELADYFNRTLLRTALRDADLQPLSGDVQEVYRLLTDDSVSRGERTRLRRRLERAGLDVDDLRADFVSYQAVRTYLKKYRGAEYETSAEGQRERALRSIQQLRGRITAVTESKLERLRNAGSLELPNFRVLVDVNVLCEECQRQYSVVSLVENGGCDCQLDRPPGPE